MEEEKIVYEKRKNKIIFRKITEEENSDGKFCLSKDEAAGGNS